MGQYYKDDAEIMYTIIFQHVGTSVIVSNIIEKHKISKNGRRCYLNLKGRFLIDSHDQTKYQHAEKKISKAAYSGGNRNWKIEDYCNIMSKVFNDLEQDGVLYTISEG